MSQFLISNYLQVAIQRLQTKDWFIHAFDLTDDKDLYVCSNYLVKSNIKYTLKLDNNIYQFIINSYKKEKVTEQFKDGIALVIFCQIANITIDPQYAIYEKINHSRDNFLLDDCIDSLEIFRQIDNTPTDELAKYLLGERDSYEVIEKLALDREKLKSGLIQHRRLTEWDSMYLIILMIIHCHSCKDFSNFEKLKKFIQLMIQDFRQSLVCFIFATIFFGRNPAKRMMKFKVSDNKQKKLQDIQNMTWDLYFMNRFFREQQNKELNQEYIYASDDKALKKIIITALNYQKTNDLKILNSHWDSEKLQEIDAFYSSLLKQPRAYLSNKWSYEYSQNLIREYEKKLGLE